VNYGTYVPLRLYAIKESRGDYRMNFQTWKYRAVLGVVAIAVLGFAFIGCGDKGGNDVAVNGVSLNPTTLALQMGVTPTGTIIATVSPSGATDKSVTWSSSNPSAATVVAIPSAPGSATVTAVASGATTITVTTKNGKTATCVVTVRGPDSFEPVTGVGLSDYELEVVVGLNRMLTAIIEPINATNKNVTWESSDPSKASVEPGTDAGTAIVRGVAVGTTTITVTTADGDFTAECEVTVTPRDPNAIPATGVTVSPKILNLTVGGPTGNLTATVAPSNATYKGVDWTSNNPTVASVVNNGANNSTGIVTAHTAGTAIITALTDDGEWTDSCTVTVTDPNAITGISLSEERLDMLIDETATLTVSVTPTNVPKNVTGSTTNSAVATVSVDTATGIATVTAKGEGEATITIASVAYPSVRATCLVSVTLLPVAVTGVELVEELDLAIGELKTLTAAVQPFNAHNKKVSWSSSNGSIATVTDEPTEIVVDGETIIIPAGTVKGIAEGTATITVTTDEEETPGNGFTADCEVTVRFVHVDTVTVSLQTLTLQMGGIAGVGSETLHATISPSNASNKSVTWSSSNTARATVNSTTGVVTAATTGTNINATGTVTITATSVDGSKIGTCQVTIERPVTGIGFWSTGTSYPTDPLVLGLEVGDFGYIYAKALPARTTGNNNAGATIRTITAVSSNPDVIFIDVDEYYSGDDDTEIYIECVGVGFAVITVTTDGVKADGTPATNTITVSPYVEDVQWVVPGTFDMGSPTNEQGRADDETQHSVTITNGFYMGHGTVTQGEYVDIMGHNPSYWPFEEFYPTQWQIFPIVSVSWYDAVEYCNRLSVSKGLTPAYTITDKVVHPDTLSITSATVTLVNSNGYRLPTEAEWEYACRAGTTGRFHTGNSLTAPTLRNGSVTNWGQANYNDVIGYPFPSWQWNPNAFGLYAMHGNVEEWCWDWYDSAYYSTSPSQDPTGPTSGTKRVTRGGTYEDPLQFVRSAARWSYIPGIFRNLVDENDNVVGVTPGTPGLGFRVVVPYSDALIAAQSGQSARAAKIIGPSKTANKQESRISPQRTQQDIQILYKNLDSSFVKPEALRRKATLE
jgi:uncharacterized protein YjdB/formylglycine-generating enzyme required for sulfatase activity